MDIDNFEILIREKKEYENLLHSLHFSIQIGKFNNSIQLIKKLRHSKFRNQNFFYNIAFLFFQKENVDIKEYRRRITALSILANIEGIHWFTLIDKSGVEAHEYINTISNFILNGLKKKSEE